MWMKRPKKCCKVRAQLSIGTTGMWCVLASDTFYVQLVSDCEIGSHMLWFDPRQVVSYILQGRLEEARQMLMKQAVLHPAARNMYKLMDRLLSKMPFYNV